MRLQRPLQPGARLRSIKGVTRDTDLMALLERRDHDAVLEALMLRYGQKVLNLCFSMMRDSSLAEDMAQVSFVKLWQTLHRYDGRAALATLLYTITRNTCLSELRKRGRTVSLDALTRADDDDSAPFSLPEDADFEARTGASHDVERLLSALPENYRQVVSLFYLEDCSVEDVAAMLDMPVNTVKSLLHRARKRLAAVALPMEKAS
jgi:RNA polymerase sigma-70 factor, ECF subfamily